MTGTRRRRNARSARRGTTRYESAFAFLVAILVAAITLLSSAPRPVLAAITSKGDDEASQRSPRALIVKYRSEGPHALEECAERIGTRREPFAPHLRDRSDSLDQLMQRFRLGTPRALFRKPGESGEPFERARRRLAERLEQRRAQAIRAHRAARPRRPLPDLAHVYRIPVPEGQPLEPIREALEADPHVEYAQPDYLIDLDQSGPPFDDPFLQSSGTWGQPYADLWGPERIGAPLVWPFAQGEGVVVAVVDSGLDRFHPDIAANVWVNPGEDLDGDGVAEPEDENGIDDDGNGFVDDLTGFDFANSFDADDDGRFDGPADRSDPDPFDDRGHGTHVAGTIAAVANNGLGLVGIAPRARIMALKGFPAEGPGDDSVLWRAVLYAAENGAAVVNNSWSCGTPCPRNPLADEVLEIVDALGVVVVTSAGNASDDVLFRSPENGRRVVTVGASGFDDALTTFSNRGWLVDLVAPGGGPDQPTSVRVARRNILSLLSSGSAEAELAFAVGDQYLRLAGTSMAAPHVSGAVALLRGLRPGLTPAEVRRLLRLSARDLGAAGHDPDFGAGLLDVAALVDTPLPDLDLELAAPADPTRPHDPADGPWLLRGRATGADLVRLEIEVGRGLSPRTFAPLEDYGDSRIEDRTLRASSSDEASLPVLARWDVADAPDGPYVLRLRAHLRDGRFVEEHVFVALERNTPLRLSRGALPVSAPTVAGRRVYWQVDESEETPQIHDVATGRFDAAQRARHPKARFGRGAPRALPAAPRGAAVGQREPPGAAASWREPRVAPPDDPLGPGEGEEASRVVVEREADQRALAADGSLLAWITLDGDDSRIGLCRVPRAGPCAPSVVREVTGTLTTLRLAGGWLVWMRFVGGEGAIEGCPVEPVGVGALDCEPRVLVPGDGSSGAGWVLRSFDGESLLLTRANELARCRLDPRDGSCALQPIVLPPGASPPIEPVHDGALLAFSEVGVERVVPPGCAVFDPRPECRGEFAVVVQYRACWIEEASGLCMPQPVSARARVEQAGGVAVSGRWVVWSMGSEVERPALHACELEPTTGTCGPAQRLLGAPAFQTRPAIDGGRLVWEDGREGPVTVGGLVLPGVDGPDRASVRAGRPFAIPLRADAGSAEGVTFEIVPLEGVAPERAQATVLDPGPAGGVVWLRGVWPSDEARAARWRVRAIGAGGLVSEHVIRLEPVPGTKRANPPARAGRPRPGA